MSIQGYQKELVEQKGEARERAERRRERRNKRENKKPHHNTSNQIPLPELLFLPVQSMAASSPAFNLCLQLHFQHQPTLSLIVDKKRREELFFLLLTSPIEESSSSSSAILSYPITASNQYSPLSYCKFHFLKFEDFIYFNAQLLDIFVTA